MGCVEVLEEIRKRSPDTRVIMLTGYPTLETARNPCAWAPAITASKPIDMEERERKVEEALAAPRA